MPRMFLRSPKRTSKSASIERGHCYARVFTRVQEWKGKKHLTFMPCDVIELLRMCLKEFTNTSRTRTTPLRKCSDGRALKLHHSIPSFQLSSPLTSLGASDCSGGLP